MWVNGRGCKLYLNNSISEKKLLTGMTEFKRLRTVNVGEHVEELEDSSIAGGSRGHHNHLGKQVGSILFCFVFNNIKHSSILRISKSTPRNFLKCKENPCP